MSVLKKLQKKSVKSNGQILKGGVILLFDTQKAFDELATLFPEIADSLAIDGDYCAYMDDYPALQVHPLSEIAEDEENIIEALRHKNLVATDFDKWFKKFK